MVCKRIVLATGFAAALLATQPRLAWSHAADAMMAPPGAVVVAPRTEARAGNVEIVAIFSKQIFAVFLSRYADGAPVTGARIEADSDLQSAKLEETDPGIYSTKDLLMAAGRNDLTLKYSLDGLTVTKQIALTMPEETPAPAAAKPAISTASPIAIAGALIAVYALLSAAFLVARRRPAKPAAIGAVPLASNAETPT